ncbi:MAG TPA: hypothetical protein VEP30_01050 [Chthoniobacterales bacterium]|nr:hypothetical protein [Chthoniobacterales bacterium]
MKNSFKSASFDPQKYPFGLLFGRLLLAVFVGALPALAQTKQNVATCRGAGLTLHSPLALKNIHDYVLEVQCEPEKKVSFRLVVDSTKILDAQGQPTKDFERALNQSVEVTYEVGKSEPYRTIEVKCLEY